MSRPELRTEAVRTALAGCLHAMVEPAAALLELVLRALVFLTCFVIAMLVGGLLTAWVASLGLFALMVWLGFWWALAMVF